MAETSPERCAVVTVAIADYDDGGSRMVPVLDAGRAFSALFGDTDGGTEHIAHNCHVGPRADEAAIRGEIRAWGATGAAVGLLLWTGHCERDRVRGAQVRTSDARVAAATLADWLVEQRFRRWVVVVDGCFAGSVLDELYPMLDKAASGPDQSCVLMGSADDISPADAGRFTAALARVLAEGPERKWWATTDRFLVVDQLIERLDGELAADPALVGARPKLGGRRWSGRVFPNPLYRPRSAAVALDEAHFLPKARGIETGEVGWYFTGRTNALRRIVDWLGATGNGLFVVTGPAGTGKSAVVGRVVTLSVPEHRRLAVEAGVLARAPEGTVPPEGVVTAAFHAREKRIDELLGFLGQALNIGEIDRAEQLIDAVGALDHQSVFVVDALDEAAAGHAGPMLHEVLAPLARIEGVKVLVGSRPGVARWKADVDAPVAGVADLSLEPRTQADIADYATERLLGLNGSTYAGAFALARIVAENVAERGLSDPAPDGRRVGSFLVARIVTRTLAGQAPVTLEPGWRERLPSGFAEAFEADLASYASRLGAGAEKLIRSVLEGLAWDEGPGLPRALIPVVTRAVTRSKYSDDDIATCLREAAGHLLEAEEMGWAVYRLYHERLREHLRDVTRRGWGLGNQDDRAVHARIADALIDWGAKRGWADTDPYLAGTLPRHASLGNRSAQLVLADRFLEHAEPAAMVAALPPATAGLLGRRVRAYRRVAHTLAGLQPDERRLVLELAAAKAGEAQLWGHQGPLAARWTSGSQHAAAQTLTGHLGIVKSVAVGELGARSVAVSGGEDGTVRTWDLMTGTPVGDALSGHQGSVEAVTILELGASTVAVSGGIDGTLRVWDLAGATQLGEPLTGHSGSVEAVTVGMVNGRTVAVSGGIDGTLRVWDLAGTRQLGKALTGHSGPVEAVAVGTVGGQTVAVSGGSDGTVRVWDLAGGTLIRELTRARKPVKALAMETIAGMAVAVVGSDDGRVQLWDVADDREIGFGSDVVGFVRAAGVGVLNDQAVVVSGGDAGTVQVWSLKPQALRDPAIIGQNGLVRGEVLTGHAGFVRAVAVGTVEGRAVAVSGGDDGTVRVWDLNPATLVGRTPVGHSGAVRAVTVATVNSQEVVVTGGDDRTVRLWDLARGSQIGEGLRGQHRHRVRAMVVALVDHRAVVVSGDDSLQVWDPASDGDVQRILTGHDGPVLALAVGAVEGRTVAISGGVDGTVRMWDLARKAQVGSTLNGHKGAVWALATGTVEGRAVAVSGGGGTMRVWDLARGTQLGQTMTGHDGTVWAIAVGPLDGRPVAVSGGADGTVRVWDLAGGTQWGRALTGHEGAVRAVAVGAIDGREVAVSGSGGVIRVWDLASAARVCVATIPALDQIHAVTIVPGGVVTAAGSHILCINIKGMQPTGVFPPLHLREPQLPEQKERPARANRWFRRR